MDFVDSLQKFIDKFSTSELSVNNKYESYLSEHIENVQRGYRWIKENLPELVDESNFIDDVLYYGELDAIIENHDKSKYNKLPDSERYYELICEYYPYANYFYGDKTEENNELFNHAWLSHIHNNPHHWQHWMLQNDEDGLKLIDIPYVFLIEMICDHWSFSWAKGDLREIFKWYDQHKDGILFSAKTRKIYENILDSIRAKLDELNY